MTAKPPHWTQNTLYKQLVHCLPAFVDSPFSESPQLNVRKLYTSVGLSYEAIYRWLRANRITPGGVDAMLRAIHTEENLRALAQLGRTAPEKREFAAFVLGS